MRVSRSDSGSVPSGTNDAATAERARGAAARRWIERVLIGAPIALVALVAAVVLEGERAASPPLRAVLLLATALLGAILVFCARRLNHMALAAGAERDEALRQVGLLGEVARELNSTLDPRHVLATAVRLAAEIASPPGALPRRANYCRLLGDAVRVEAEFDADGDYIGATWPLSEHPLLARAVRDREPTSGVLDPATLGPRVRRLADQQQVGHGAWVPVSVNGEVHGVLAVAGRNRAVSEREIAHCVAIVRILELALENALAHEHTKRAARTDPLTSLANRRGMEQAVAERRGRRPLTVMAIDVDNLKRVNDTYGHGAGDRLLLQVADVITSTSRTGDAVARFGGDEFVSVLFDADRQDGARVAKRILAALAHPLNCRFAPRVSIGLAEATADEELGTLVRRADAAMYEAKRAGGMRYSDLESVVAVSDAAPDTEVAPRRR